MKPRPPLPEGPYLVVGLARSGQAVARLLAARGGVVIGCDSGEPVGAAGLAEAGVEVHLNVDGTHLLEEVKTVVKSPGVPGEAPVIEAAGERDLELTGELELSWRALPNRFLAVTGTNGKTTTTELLGHIHRAAGEPVAVAGNVGTPLASLALEGVDDGATVVCECSSFQLEDSSAFSPECAVFLNLEADHLDRHGTLENYLAAKLRIFANQESDDVAVYNGDEPMLRDAGVGGAARRVSFCPRLRDRPAGVPPGEPERCATTLDGSEIRWRGEKLVETGELKLLGGHNVENAMAAATAALESGLEPEAVREGLLSFEGVPHRLEVVRELGGVRYVNDSKATNVASALAGLESFERGVHLILGGSTKGETFERLADPVRRRCVACYLIGEAAPRLAEDLVPAARKGLDLLESGTLERAVQEASSRAKPSETVLLSPACASFDQFEDFEARGERFRELVEALR